MRISRDVVRPLVALLVVVAAIGLVSNVAAYRAATTHPRVGASGSNGCQSVGVASDRDGDRDADRQAEACRSSDDGGRTGDSAGSREAGERGDGDGDGDGAPRIVTTSGAS